MSVWGGGPIDASEWRWELQSPSMIGRFVGWLRHRWLRRQLRLAARKERRDLAALKPFSDKSDTMKEIVRGRHNRHD